MKRVHYVVLFTLGFGLGVWLFRWSCGGNPAVGWGQMVYRFGVSWQFSLDYDFDGHPDRIEYVKPRWTLWLHLWGDGPPHNPDYREISWRVGPVRRVRVWFQLPVNHNVLVASVSFGRGPEVVVAGQSELCSLLNDQPLVPFGFLPSVADVGCGKSWPLH